MNQGFTSSRSLKNQDTASRKINTLLKLNRERERALVHPKNKVTHKKDKGGTNQPWQKTVHKNCGMKMTVFKSNMDLLGYTLN
jgi:hypothetical protein